jgi:hypothetical protein
MGMSLRRLKGNLKNWRGRSRESRKRRVREWRGVVALRKEMGKLGDIIVRNMEIVISKIMKLLIRFCFSKKKN